MRNNRVNNNCVDYFLTQIITFKKLAMLDVDLSVNEIENKGAI